MKDIQSIIDKQKEYFNNNETLDYKFRLHQLSKLKFILKENQSAFFKTLYEDMNKSEMEAFLSEFAVVYQELDYHIKKLKKHMRPNKVKTPLTMFKSQSSILARPYGQVLIIAPFNYPLHLVFMPLIGAIAAGNTCIIKPSEQTLKTSTLMYEILNKVFDEKYLYVVDPNLDLETLNSISKYEFDFIFFTGSGFVGQIVLENASKYLTPVVLELGGKSPVIIDESAKLEIAATRIIFSKILNASQTCIAPDYLLVPEKLKDEFLNYLINQIKKQFIKEDYVKIINKKAMLRLMECLKDEKVLYQGEIDLDSLYFEPTIIEVTNLNSKVMQQEIFGPIIPIITYNDFEEVFDIIKLHPNPLALYYFSENKKRIDYIIDKTKSGDVLINDTIIHTINHHLPFGGVKQSGMGSYHGKHSFDTFSYQKSVVKSSSLVNMNIRYYPYTKIKKKIIKKFFGF